MKKIKQNKNITHHKTYVFIDASNIIYGASGHGWKMDFKKLAHYLKTRYNAVRLFYYAGLDSDNKKQLRFYEKLQEFGYELRLVPVKIFRDGHKKADVDSKMTFEIMKYLEDYEQAVVMTGDGDFYWVLEYLLEEKRKVKLLAHISSTAKELKQLFKENFTGMHTIRDLVSMEKIK